MLQPKKKVVKKIVAAPAVKKLQERKIFKGYAPQIRSRHPSHSPLRKQLPRLSVRSVVRLGSDTILNDVVEKGGKRIEVNTVEACKNSADKLRMKNCFKKLEVKTADWIPLTAQTTEAEIKEFCKDNETFVLKSRFGSRGRGNTLCKGVDKLLEEIRGKDKSNYIIEKFYNYNREYRLHVTSEGCFYTCRKMLKENTPEKDRWFRNDSNSVWFMDNNPQFDRPVNWDNIVAECVKALNSVGLDFGACDLRVQSSKNDKGGIRENPDFIIVEINSAPSFGEQTLQHYLEEIPKIIKRKANLQ